LEVSIVSWSGSGRNVDISGWPGFDFKQVMQGIQGLQASHLLHSGLSVSFIQGMHSMHCLHCSHSWQASVSINSNIATAVVSVASVTGAAVISIAVVDVSRVSMLAAVIEGVPKFDFPATHTRHGMQASQTSHFWQSEFGGGSYVSVFIQATQGRHGSQAEHSSHSLDVSFTVARSTSNWSFIDSVEMAGVGSIANGSIANGSIASGSSCSVTQTRQSIQGSHWLAHSLQAGSDW
jgi:hypothetical protein